jgi:peptide/nickel transport system substrate-binding protein
MRQNQLVALSKGFSVLAVAAVVAACGTSQSTAQSTNAPGQTNASGQTNAAGPTSAPGATKDTLVIAIPGLAASMDPEGTTGAQFWTMGSQVFPFGLNFQTGPYPYTETIGDPTKVAGFTYPNLDFSKVQPGMLDKCTLSADGLTGTINIHPGVKAQTGDELTSSDILWGVQRSAALKANGAFFNSVANAADPNQWTAADKYTVVVKGTIPMADLCPLFTHEFYSAEKFYDVTEIKKHVTADDPWATKWLDTHVASYGAYYLSDWQPGKQAVMQANPNYAGTLPFKTVIWQVVPDASGRVALLNAGKVDVVEGLSIEQAKSLNGSADVNVVSVRGNSELFAIMNNSKAPFDKAQVRTALNMAVPRDDIVNSIYQGMAVPWEGVIPSIYAGYQANHAYDYNIAQAKSLLAQAGYPDGFSTTLSYSSGDPVQEEVAILYQTSLKQIGVNVTLQKLPPAAMTDLATGGKADFGLWSDAPILPDPVFSQGLWWWAGSGSIWPKAIHFSDPKFESEAAACNAQGDWNARVTCSQQMSQTIIADAPFVFITQPNFVYAASSHLTGLNWNPAITYVIADGWAWKP